MLFRSLCRIILPLVGNNVQLSDNFALYSGKKVYFWPKKMIKLFVRPLFLFVLLLVFNTANLTGQSPRELHLTGVAHRENGQWHAARQAFASAKTSAQRNSDWDTFVENAIRESEVLAWAMKPDSARMVLSQAESVCAKQLGASDSRAWRLKTFWLEVQQIDGKGDKVLKESQKIVEYWKAKGKDAVYDLALTHLYIGKIRSDLGDFGGAAPELEAAVLVLKKRSDAFYWELQDAYAFLGNVHIFMGQFDPGKAYLNNAEALAVQKRPAPHFRTANILRLRANINALKAEFKPALEKYRQALAQLDPYPECNNPRAMLCSNISLMYGKLKEFDQSIAWAKQAQELYEKGFGKRHVRLVKVYSNLGIAYETKLDYKKSHFYAQEALKCLAPEWEPKGAFDLPPTEAFNYTRLFLLKMTELGTYLDLQYLNNKDPRYLEAAYEAYNWTIEAGDRLRNELDTEDAQFSLQTYAELPQCYEHAIQTAYALYKLKGDERYLQQALSFMEKRKSSTLYLSLQGQEALRFGGIPKDVLTAEKQLKGKLSDARRRYLALPSEADENTRLKVSKERAEADAQYRDFLRKLADDYPDYYSIQYSTATPDLDKIQKYLAKHQSTLLEYHISTNIDSSAIYIVKISPQERKMYSVRIPDTFPQAVEALLKTATNAQETIEKGNSKTYFNDFAKRCYQLYQTLLKPVLKPSDENLVVVADDVLYRLPFEMLLEQAPTLSDGRVNYSSLPWVLKNRSIRYAFSTGLLMLKRKSTRASKSLAAFAPVFTGDGHPSSNTRSMARLRFARDEASSVAALLGGMTFLGDMANKKSLQKIAEDFQIIHIASHAVTEAESPLLSYIALGDTSRLYAYELYDWQIRSDMAVLSACNTGNGELAGGEGVMSIARAFRYAGCPNLLVSLWQVDDESTRILMEHFYKHLKNGEPKHEALRHAKLEYLAAKHKIHPYFWAPFVLLGDDEPVTQQNSWPWWMIAGMVAGVIGIGAFMGARRRLS